MSDENPASSQFEKMIAEQARNKNLQERNTFSVTSVIEILQNPTKIGSLSTECPPKPSLETSEWDEVRNIMRNVGNLVELSDQRQNREEDTTYCFDMGIGYTQMYAYQNETDPNLTCVVRVQPIPEKISDYAYDTKGKTILPEQVRKKDVMMSLRYKLDDGSWSVCCMRYSASEDFALLLGDPTVTDQLRDRNLPTDLDYFSVFKPQYMSFWIENKKPDSEMKELGLLIPSADQILQALQASSEISDFAGMLSNDMSYYLQQLDQEGVTPEIESFAHDTQNNDELRALAMSLLEKLKGAANYQIRAIPVSQETLGNINKLLADMSPKQIETNDLLPPSSLVDASSEEWKAFHALGA